MESNEANDLIKKYQELAQQQAGQQPCPNCGRCPTCGRGGYYTQPYYPPAYPYPTNPWPWTTWTVDGGR